MDKGTRKASTKGSKKVSKQGEQQRQKPDKVEVATPALANAPEVIDQAQGHELGPTAPTPAAASASAQPALERKSTADYLAHMRRAQEPGSPINPFVDALLTDLYQLTMCYAYWKGGRHNEDSVFDLFFRTPPFEGSFTIFGGLEEVIRYVASFRFSPADIAVLQDNFPMWEPGFFGFLASMDTSKVKMFAIPEGSVVFPRVPLIRFEGPLAVVQLLETTSLVLVNYASLVATNAARHRLAVGPTKTLLEFGLRRAQGPDGAMSASRYAYMGGFDGTSNVKAGMAFGIPVKGTHAHSFVSSFSGMGDLNDRTIKSADGKVVDFGKLVIDQRNELGKQHTNEGELAAFVQYAQAYPTGFLALVDTYDTLASGVWNFVIVALALAAVGYKAVGIRLDSGDLAYLSKQARLIFQEVGARYSLPQLAKSVIVASNDISEDVLWSLKEEGHEVDSFGIGTNLVTCKSQPALGGVFKLVEAGGKPRIKLSNELAKVSIPGRKEAYRLFGSQDQPICDLLVSAGTFPPQPHHRVLCRHPFDANKRAYVTPSRVEALHRCVWDGRLVEPFETLETLRTRARVNIASLRPDHVRKLNPTPYKVSLSSDLYTYMHDLWLAESPIAEIN